MIVSLALLGLLSLVNVMRSFDSALLWQKDFANYWLASKGTISGLAPYTNLHTLSKSFAPPHDVAWAQPLPYPPFSVVAMSPLGLMPMKMAAVFWLVLQMLSLFGAVSILVRELSGSFHLGKVLVITAVLLGWEPINTEMVIGQMAVILLFPLAVTWAMFRNRRDGLAGIALGIALATKLAGWPLGLLFVMEKRWKAVVSTAVTWFVAHAIGGMNMGFSGIVRYYTEVAPLGAKLFELDDMNIAIFALGRRFFDGTSCVQRRECLEGGALLPLPHGGALIGYGLLAATILLVSVLAWRTRDSDLRFAMFATIAIVANPIAWPVYLSMGVLPFGILLTTLWRGKFSRPYYVILGLLSVPLLFHEVLMRWVKLPFAMESGQYPVPPIVALFPGVLTLSLLGVVLFIYAMDRQMRTE